MVLTVLFASAGLTKASDNIVSKKENVDLKDKIAVLENKVATLESQNKELEDEKERLQSEKKELENQIGQLNRTIIELNNKINELNNTIAEFQKKKESLQEVSPPQIRYIIGHHIVYNLMMNICGHAEFIGATREEITTKDEMERFLSSIKYPYEMDSIEKQFYLASKLLQWDKKLWIGYFAAFGGKLKYKTGIAVAVMNEAENKVQLYRIEENTLKLIPFNSGDAERLTMIFP
jgi:prefoldin subunit 5